MNKIVLASHNEHKIQEIRAMLPINFQLFSLKDIGFNEEIPETSNSFRGNAIQKAKYIKIKTGFDCMADDSGLEVDALNGQPGIFSARYAGDHANHSLNNQKLLRELTGIQNRKANFRSVIALIFDSKEYFFEGAVYGNIIDNLRGEEGFGYDPLFIPEGYDKTFAEMDLSLKNKISHRAIAIEKLIEFLNNYGYSGPKVEYC